MRDALMFTQRAFGAMLFCALLVASPVSAELARTHGSSAAIKPEPIRHGMQSAAPRKANGSGVEVQFRFDGPVQRGEPLRVIVGFAGFLPGEGSSVRFSADPGLMLPAAYTIASKLPANAMPPELTVQITPVTDGLAYLHVFTTQSGATSVSSIAIQTGSPAVAKPRADLHRMPDGELIQVLPVQ